ncbi:MULTISPECIES: DUF1223 domain-containing protein [Vibrio]|jgi:hypothetical protein|uniref:DUF1223 domain-containing protein n=1 Tax=Vibrio harveyi TaxID=669 RepID=A0A454CTY6_VIBHA|nr:hypothetical protein VCHENC02_4356 [Vibrio harveyi]EKO3803380.1 DUF1223 domain-containing protein [Vibrio harveyi]EKO3852764.1 DUF1223 domain-containing protein [Vibrio harveyi]HDM8138666.1 DUF1223 domain-containing protein [Vibrio harveyi]
MINAIALAAITSLSASQSWVHEGQPAQVIELFTSEGCSSCPPADKYLSTFQSNPDLWEKYIPVAYHVDYWDYLGWKDKFAKPEFSQLQRLYRAYGAVGSVYTPAFVVDSEEWRGFFNWRKRVLPSNDNVKAQSLTLERSGNQFSLRFEEKGSYDATIVFLSSNETTPVKRGENRGKVLEHDFVALEKQQGRSKSGEWTFKLNQPINNIDAVAAWVTEPGTFNRVQTVAGEIR